MICEHCEHCIRPILLETGVLQPSQKLTITPCSRKDYLDADIAVKPYTSTRFLVLKNRNGFTGWVEQRGSQAWLMLPVPAMPDDAVYHLGTSRLGIITD